MDGWITPEHREEEQESSHQREERLGKAGMARDGGNGDGTLRKKWLWKAHFKRIKEKKISKPFNPGKKPLNVFVAA